MSTWWPRLRKVWAIGGSLALAVWVAWCAIAFAWR